jgi:ribosome-associated protein
LLVVNQHIRVRLRELRFTFSRSSGAGGQNVNKLNTKATLRWAVARSPSLPQDVRARFLRRHARRITASGDLVITSQRFRDRGRNVADCLEKLRAMLAEVAVPKRRRRRTKPTRASVERRIEGKRRTRRKKQQRRRIRSADNGD